MSGRRHRRNGDFGLAVDAYEDYLDIALKAQKEGVNGVNSHWPIYWLFRSRADWLKSEERFSDASDKLDKGKNYLQSLEVDSGDIIDELVGQLRGVQYELNGDEELSRGNLKPASKSYGEAIGTYMQYGDDKSADYLKQRRKLIEASISEQQGDFSSAKDAHEEICRLTTDIKFKEFNKARAKISRAKSSLIEFRFEEAMGSLPTELDTSNVANVEAQHLSFLLGILSEYEKGNIQNIRKVLDKLQEMPDIDAVGGPFPFEYGHDYRPAIVNVLAAQRLKRFNIDANLLNELLQISISDVLSSPERIEKQIKQSGIESIDLRGQWKERFPTHIVQKYQETRSKEISGVGNFADEALSLLKLIEQALELVGDYYLQRSMGKDWAVQISGDGESRLSLGSLRDMLNKSTMRDLIWCGSVTELLDQEIIGEPDVVSLRNALGHDRRSKISEAEYDTVRERVELIFSRMSNQVPIATTLQKETITGLYEFIAHWENPRNRVRVQTEDLLEINQRYYIPVTELNPDPVLKIDSGAILPIRATRVNNNLTEYIG